jgi:hypothetical protein
MNIQTYLLISSLAATATLYPMLSRWDHSPIENEYNLQRISYDRELPDVDHINIKQIIHPTDSAYGPHRYLSCFEKAMHETLGLQGICGFISGKNEYTDIDIEKYFQQVAVPKKGNLVIYTESSQDLSITHFGVLHSAKKMDVESQWGKNKARIIHKHNAVPFCYGLAMGCFELKPEYHDKKVLEKTLTQDVKIAITRYEENKALINAVLKEHRNEINDKVYKKKLAFIESRK